MTTRRQYQATAAAALPVDRYQPRPARRKKKPGCLPLAGAVLLALALAGFAAYLGGARGEALMVAASIVVIVGFPLSITGGAKED